MSAAERRRRARDRQEAGGVADAAGDAAGVRADAPSRPVPELPLVGPDGVAPGARRSPIAPGSPEAEAAYLARRNGGGPAAATAGRLDDASVSPDAPTVMPPASSGAAAALGEVTGPVAVGTLAPPAAPPGTEPALGGGADLVAVVAEDRSVRFVSAGVERLLGVEGAAAVGCDALGIVVPEDRVAVGEIFEDLVRRRVPSAEFRCHVRRSGRFRDGGGGGGGDRVELQVTAEGRLDGTLGGVVVTAREISERSRLAERVREVDRRQSALVEALTDGLLVVDVHGRIVRVNHAFEALFALTRAELVGRRFEEILAEKIESGIEIVDETGAPVDLDEHPLMVSLQRNQRVVGAEVGYRGPAGGVHWTQVNVQPVTTADGGVAGAVATFSDVTVKRGAEYALRQEREFLRVLLETLDEGIVACDSQGRMTVFNSAARAMHGLPPDVEPIGRTPSSRYIRNPDGTPLGLDENPLLLAMSGRRLRDHEILLATPDGRERVVRVNGQSLEDEFGWKLGAVVAMHDVTEEKRSREELRHLAYHDQLTGLANRLKLYEAMQVAIADLEPRMGATGLPVRRLDPDAGERRAPLRPALAVYLLDLDGFKSVNDSHGHRTGDELLKAVADRLVSVVRPEDTVARLSGDEFVVMCSIEHGEHELEAVRSRIAEALARPYRILGATVHTAASVGATMTEDPEADYSHLLGLADDDMFEIKATRGTSRRVQVRPEPPTPAPDPWGARGPVGVAARRGPIPPGGTSW